MLLYCESANSFLFLNIKCLSQLIHFADSPPPPNLYKKTISELNMAALSWVNHVPCSKRGICFKLIRSSLTSSLLPTDMAEDVPGF